MTLPRRIVGLGGGGFSRFGRFSKLDDYVLSLTQKDHPRVLYLGTAGGDADSHIVLFYEAFSGRARPAHLKLFGAPSRMEWRPLIREQDVIYVGGGNTANMLAIWRVHGMDQALREAWDDGVVLCGVSAGMNCWFECSVSDSFGLDLAALRDGLGFLPGSVCPHYDGEERRRPVYRQLVAEGLPAGYAVEDSVGIVFHETEFAEAVTEIDGHRAYRVEMTDGEISETVVPTRSLVSSAPAPASPAAPTPPPAQSPRVRR
ncbi:MAG TPA: peptidase E [Candidatus Dormibacteraeota bacterium]|nr:peptidase E [Candidatus Dormibacteraeota bacterium]